MENADDRECQPQLGGPVSWDRLTGFRLKTCRNDEIISNFQAFLPPENPFSSPSPVNAYGKLSTAQFGAIIVSVNATIWYYFFRCFPGRSSCAAFADDSMDLPCQDRETLVSLICSFLFRSPYFPNRPLPAISTPKNVSKKVKR